MKYIFQILLMCLSLLIALMMGDSFIEPLQVIQGLLHKSDDYTNLVINTLRLPRVLLAAVVGSALGIAGCVLQRITKNTLASPDVIGISQGAIVGSLFFLIILTTQTEQLLFPIAYQSVMSMIGALIVTFILYHLTMKRTFLKERLILLGICLNIFFQGMIMFLIMSSDKRSAQAQIWITGSVHLAEYYQIIIVACSIMITLIILSYYSMHLDIHQLGYALSHALGNHYQKITMISLLLVSLLIGLSMSFVGGIQFIGLIAPHIAGHMTNKSFKSTMINSAIIGALLLIYSDLLGRTLFLPIEIPAGVFTAFIGAPFFMYLLFKKRIHG